MVNPFDPRTVFLAKHAQHVVLIHFPIALFTSGVAFDLISRGRRTSSWASAAYLNLTAAAITVFPALGTGLLAWQFVLGGKTPQRLAAVTSRRRRVYGVSSGCDLDAALASSQVRKGHASPVSHFSGIARRASHCTYGASRGFLSGVNS
jgi:hypothetical protein